MRRRIVCAALTAALALAGSAGAAPPTATPGTLTVALNMPSDGFQVGAVKGREVVAARGLEVDLAREVATALGLELRLVQEPRFSRILDPGAASWDMALAQVSIGEGRGASVDFSVPYLTADQGVLMSLSTRARPTSTSDLAGLRLCAQKGTTGADLIARTIRPRTPALLPLSTTVLTRGLYSGRCEAVVFDAPGLAALRAAVPTRYGPLAGVVRTGERYGAVFPKGSRLRGPVNRAIATLKRNGTLAAVVARWVPGSPATLPVLGTAPAAP